MPFTSSEHCSQCIFVTLKQLKIKKNQKGTLGRNYEVQVSGPLNAAEICKLAVDSKIHLAIVFLAIVPSNHDNLNFPGCILEIGQNH